MLFVFFSFHGLLGNQLKNLDSECVVLLSNKKYFGLFIKTLNLLTTKGNYHGDICLVIGNDLLQNELLDHPLIVENNVIIKYFPDLRFTYNFFRVIKHVKGLDFLDKLFQYHKFHLFNSYFKQWKTILYLDSGMEIYSDIHPILAIKKSNKLIAHSDAYPTYVWTLKDQFNKTPYRIYEKLSQSFDLNGDYFQTTMMLYDTEIIKENTFANLYDLCLKYPISKTNDQGIIALYFTKIFPVWSKLPIKNEDIYLYDFIRRDKFKKYIMIKYPQYQIN